MKKTLSAAFLAAVLVTGLMGQVAFAHGVGVNGNVAADVKINKGHNDDGDGRGLGAGVFSNLRTRFFLKGDHNDDGHKDNGDRGERHKDDTSDNDDSHRDVRASGVARVTAVSSTTITAEKAVGSSEKTFTLHTDSDTEFSLRNGDSADLGDVDEGDLISFRGTATAHNSSNIAIDADHVRIWGDVDLSAKAKVTGTVTSVDDNDDQLVIETENDETVTVNMADLTRVKDEDGDHGVFADIAVGATVKIKGWWNSVKDTITAVKVRIL